jgi:hypothetical protein
MWGGCTAPHNRKTHTRTGKCIMFLNASVDYTRLQVQLPKFIIHTMVQLPFGLTPLLINGGTLEIVEDQVIRFTLPTHSKKYCDAQVDDYHLIPREQFPWSPPCRMILRARASHPDPPGTLGFGFWNDPFTISIGQGGAARRFPVPPQSIWFFYGSKENDIRLNPRFPGHGWKASTIRSPKIPGLILAPAAAVAMATTPLPIFRTWIMNIIQRIEKVDEVMLKAPLDQWHTYSIDWSIEAAIFHVDGIEVLRAEDPPTGPLGFVAWIDNQYALASPESRFRFGVIPTIENQWFEIEMIDLKMV